jgi:RimJ/RimL family protein N-acetyltransferase
MTIPYRLRTPRLMLRCWNPEDAPRVQPVIEANVAHLSPWMPWVAAEPVPVEEKAATLRRFRAAFDRDEDYVYGMFSPDGERIMGGCGLHKRVGPKGIEIGYWVDKDHLRQGLATEATCVLTRVAMACMDVDRVELHIDPKNHASAGVAETLGFGFEGVLRRRFPLEEGQLRDTGIWTVFRADYANTPVRAKAQALELEAYDLMGRRMSLGG